MTNVRKVMNNQLIVDPRGVEMLDLKDRNPVIRLKATVPEGMSIDHYIKQLAVTDVTVGHIQDMSVVQSFSEQATGLQDNLMGQYSSGRRSAREASNVNANAAGRVITPIKGLWEAAILPLGRKLLCNHRQGLDEEQLIKIIGLQRFILESQPDPTKPLEAPAVQAFLPVDKSTLVGDYDFLVFEGTLPSQRVAMANVLLQTGEILMKNPASVLAIGVDPQPIFWEMLELQGIRNAERFRLTPQRAGELIALAGVARNGGGTPAPGGQVQSGGGGGRA